MLRDKEAHLGTQVQTEHQRDHARIREQQLTLYLGDTPSPTQMFLNIQVHSHSVVHRDKYTQRHPCAHKHTLVQSRLAKVHSQCIWGNTKECSYPPSVTTLPSCPLSSWNSFLPTSG